MTSVDPNPPPFLDTPCSSRNDDLTQRIYTGPRPRRTPACTMPGGEENGERSQVEQRLMEGAEPFHFEGNGTGILVSHGFTGTPQSVRPLGEALAEEGFTVMGPRLAGHGTDMEDHAQSTALDWISSIEQGLT